MKFRPVKEAVAELRGETRTCQIYDCPSPTDRTRVVHGARLCRACHWQLLICTVNQPTPEGQALMKDDLWREKFKPTAEEVAKFLAAFADPAESLRKATP